MNSLLEQAPEKTEALKMVQRINKAIGKADPATVFIACSMIMQVNADLMGIEYTKIEGEK